MLSHVLGHTKMLEVPTTFHVPGIAILWFLLTPTGHDTTYTTTVHVPETANFALFLKFLLKKYNTEFPDKQVEEILNAYVVGFPSVPDFGMLWQFFDY